MIGQLVLERSLRGPYSLVGMQLSGRGTKHDDRASIAINGSLVVEGAATHSSRFGSNSRGVGKLASGLAHSRRHLRRIV